MDSLGGSDRERRYQVMIYIFLSPLHNMEKNKKKKSTEKKLPFLSLPPMEVSWRMIFFEDDTFFHFFLLQKYTYQVSLFQTWFSSSSSPYSHSSTTSWIDEHDDRPFSQPRFFEGSVRIHPDVMFGPPIQVVVFRESYPVSGVARPPSMI